MLASKQWKKSLSNRPVLRLFLILLVFMSLQRFLFFWNFLEKYEGLPAREIWMAHLVGIRFDLLILGFFLVPVVLLKPLLRWPKALPPERARRVFPFFVASFWTLISALSLMDFLYFSFRGRRLTWTDFQAPGSGEVFSTSLERLGATTFFMNVAIFFCLWLIGLQQAARFREEKAFARPEGAKAFWSRWFLQLILVALLARGSVTAHHLDWRHARVSESRTLQELTVNSLWVWDKDPRRN